jgi:hypothetical protein
MKSFKQYLNEDFPHLQGVKGQDDEYGYPTFSITSLPSDAKSLGRVKVGDEIFHFHHAIEPIDPTWNVPPDSIGYVTKMVNGKHEVIGHARFGEENHDAIGNHFIATDPVLQKEHRKKGLMSELYKRWAIGNRKILRSGSYQSHGGRNIWNELADKVDVHVMNDDAGKNQKFPRYDPKKSKGDEINQENHTFVYFPEGRK